MAVAGILATALTGGSPARVWGLYVDGLDVAQEPGTGRYGAPIEDVQVALRGPGNVSSMSFTLDDPTGLLSFTDGQMVLLLDHSRDVLWFRGWIENYSSTPLPPTGRYWNISVVGVEIMLDWYVVTDAFTFAAGTSFQTAVQSLAASAIGAGELRVGADLVSNYGSQANPVGLALLNLSVAVTIDPSTTLREALNELAAGCYAGSKALSANATGINFTVDHRFGLRVWPRIEPPTSSPASTITVRDDSTSLALYHASDLTIEVDVTDIVRAVVVRGGSGIVVTVNDGGGKRGRTAVLSDTTLTTVATATSAGLAYLSAYQAVLSGTARIEDLPAGAVNVSQLGSDMVIGLVSINDPQVLSAQTNFRITAADASFFGGNANVGLTFGRSKRSMTRLVRRLTRATLS